MKFVYTVYHASPTRFRLPPPSPTAYNEKMRSQRSALTIFVVCLLAATTSSCVARRRLIPRASNSKPLLTADLTQLLAVVQKQYDAIRDFSAQVDMVPAVGSTEKNHITEYKDVRAYIRFRKPGFIRMLGLMPVIHTPMFDMVSNGADFKLYIPSKALFVVGRDTVEQLSTNHIENLRPRHFREALVVDPIDLKINKAVLGNFTDEDNAYYIIHEERQQPDGTLKLLRDIWFSRIDLTMSRQMIFDVAANILSDARYSQWQKYDNVPFPKHIEINRPRDEYAIVLDIVKMDINKGVPDPQFVLDQPEGTTLRPIGQAAQGPPK